MSEELPYFPPNENTRYNSQLFWFKKKGIKGESIEFLFILAKELRKTIYEILTGRPGMTTFEFFCWRFYYGEKPFGDLLSPLDRYTKIS